MQPVSWGCRISVCTSSRKKEANRVAGDTKFRLAPIHPDSHRLAPAPFTLTAAANAGVWDAVRTRIRALFDDPAARSGFVASVIGKEVGLD